MLRPIHLAFALSALLAAAPALGQSSAPTPSGSFAAAFSGASRPLSLTLQDLDGSWRVFSLSGAGDSSGQVQIYLALLTGGAQTTYYTKGETVTLGGEAYLVAYRQKLTVDYIALLKGDEVQPPSPPKLTPSTALSLSLLNLRSVGSLNDIQPFSLQAALNPPSPPAPDPKEATVSDMKQLGLAFIQYTQDYDEKLPPMKTAAAAKTALFPYAKSDSVFEQPQTHALFQPNTSLSGRSLATFNDPASMVIYYEAAPEDDGQRAVLFLDGHVKRMADADWQRVKSASHVPNPPQSIQ